MRRRRRLWRWRSRRARESDVAGAGRARGCVAGASWRRREPAAQQLDAVRRANRRLAARAQQRRVRGTQRADPLADVSIERRRRGQRQAELEAEGGADGRTASIYNLRHREPAQLARTHPQLLRVLARKRLWHACKRPVGMEGEGGGTCGPSGAKRDLPTRQHPRGVGHISLWESRPTASGCTAAQRPGRCSTPLPKPREATCPLPKMARRLTRAVARSDQRSSGRADHVTTTERL